jgi:hypothetical protein
MCKQQAAEVLGWFSFRALVAGTKRKRKTDMKGPATEASRLDDQYKSELPGEPLDFVNGKAGVTLADVPPQFHSLLRYDAVGLLPQLIPVSRRAQLLLPDYFRFKAGANA